MIVDITVTRLRRSSWASLSNMTATERMLSAREQLKSICHLSAHGIEFFTRSQARAVLGMTLALLAEPTVGFFSIDNSIEGN